VQDPFSSEKANIYVSKQEELQNKAILQKMSATRKGISSDDFNNDPQGDREAEYRY